MWVSRRNSPEFVSSRSRSGRPPLLSTPGKERAVDLLLGTMQGASHVGHVLHEEGLAPKPVSKQTVIRGARELAALQGVPLKVWVGKPEKELTQANKDARLAFAERNKNTNWAKVMFTDRKRFQFRHPGVAIAKKRWIRKGTRLVGFKASHPMSVNVYCGLTVHGTTSAHVVAGTSKHKTPHLNKKGDTARNITAGGYREVVSGTFLPEGATLFAQQGVYHWKLQQDNDPTHRVAKAVIEEWSKGSISKPTLLEDYPANSPDFNPIENFWTLVEVEVEKMGCKTFDEFKAAVLNTIKKWPKDKCRALVLSMKRRLQLAIQLGGDKTGY